MKLTVVLGKQNNTAVISDISDWSCHTQSDKADDLTIHFVLKLELFPRLKFINKKVDMEYTTDPKKLCGFMLKHCNVQLIMPKDANKEAFEKQLDDYRQMWWQNTKKEVTRIYCNLRNNKIKAIEKVFQGKCIVNTLFHQHAVSNIVL